MNQKLWSNALELAGKLCSRQRPKGLQDRIERAVLGMGTDYKEVTLNAAITELKHQINELKHNID